MDLASRLGGFLATQGMRVVYGGAQGGLMGAVADAALDKGGEVIGVLPEILSDRERAHKGLSALHITKDLHERQQKMAALADAFVVLPGGTGTLAEFFEILTWKQIGLHEKPIILANIYGFWGGLLDALDHGFEEGFLYQPLKDVIEIFDTMDDLEGFFSA